MKKILLSSFIFACLFAVACHNEESASDPNKNHVISYTSSDGAVVTPCAVDVFGSNIVSNVYENGKGVITFDAPVTLIGEGAFEGCDRLASITIPNGVTLIGEDAFEGCSSLVSITIPDSVTSIEEESFVGCENLVGFYGKYATPDNRCLVVNGVLISFAPVGVAEYTIPNSATSIGSCAFYGCYNLASVTIPNSVTSIGDYAFDECSSLTSVTVPNSVTLIGYGAFQNCSSLTSVYCKPTTPPSGDFWMFRYNASGRKIYVPRNSVEAYKSARYWSDYASDIVGYDF